MFITIMFDQNITILKEIT